MLEVLPVLSFGQSRTAVQLTFTTAEPPGLAELNTRLQPQGFFAVEVLRIDGRNGDPRPALAAWRKMFDALPAQQQRLHRDVLQSGRQFPGGLPETTQQQSREAAVAALRRFAALRDDPAVALWDPRLQEAAELAEVVAGRWAAVDGAANQPAAAGLDPEIVAAANHGLFLDGWALATARDRLLDTAVHALLTAGSAGDPGMAARYAALAARCERMAQAITEGLRRHP